MIERTDRKNKRMAENNFYVITKVKPAEHKQHPNGWKNLFVVFSGGRFGWETKIEMHIVS